MMPTAEDAAFGSGLIAALRGNVSEVRFAVLPWSPVSKPRPRFGRRGRVYTPAEQTAAETLTAYGLRELAREPYAGNVALVCLFYRADRRRIDADNMLKHVQDAANGVLWADDSQVTAVVGIVEYDKANPRTVVAVAPHVSTMKRGKS